MTIIQGGRRVLTHNRCQKYVKDRVMSLNRKIDTDRSSIDDGGDEEDDEDDEAQAEAEEYANMSLIDVGFYP